MGSSRAGLEFGLVWFWVWFLCAELLSFQLRILRWHGWRRLRCFGLAVVDIWLKSSLLDVRFLCAIFVPLQLRTFGRVWRTHYAYASWLCCFGCIISMLDCCHVVVPLRLVRPFGRAFVGCNLAGKRPLGWLFLGPLLRTSRFGLCPIASSLNRNTS